MNAVWGGYAVGVAGLVGFIPAKQCARPTARRIGQLQKFRILEVNRSRPSLVLADPNLHFGSPDEKAQRTSGFFNPKRELKQAEAQKRREARRQELMRVADELRSVLALRGSQDNGGSSSGGSGSKP